MSWTFSPLLPGAAQLRSTPTLLYWVGGAGTWDLTTTTNWAATSGGTGGAGVPANTTAVIFDNNSGTGTVTINGGVCGDLTLTSTVSAVTLAPTTSGLSIYGNVLIQGTGATISGSAAITFAAVTSKTITTGGETFDCPVTFNGVAGTWVLQDNMVVGSTRTTTLTNGTLDLNGKNFSTGIFSSINTNTRALISLTAATVNITSASTGTVWSIGFTSTMTGSNNITVDITGNNAGTSKDVDAGDFTNASNAFNFTLGGNGTQIVLTNGGVINNLTITNTTCNIVAGGSTIYGNLNVAGTGPFMYNSNPTPPAFKFASTSGTKTITTNGEPLNLSIEFNGVGGTWQLVDNLTVTTTYSSIVTLTNGTLDLNGKTLNSGSSFATATGTKNLTFNGGTLLCPAASATAFNNAQPTNFTTTAGIGTGKISMSATTAKSFIGGGSTYNCTLENAGAGALTISGNNTITTISNSVQPTTFTFTSGSTQTVTNFSVSGTSGNLVTINSTSAGSPATLSKASGTVSVSYCSIKDNTATGGATWLAYTSSGNVNNGGNSGWLFAAATAGYVKIYMGSGPGWVYKPVKTWDGTQWVIKPAKWYNTGNTTWVTTSGL